jgi:hypothetical protein
VCGQQLNTGGHLPRNGQAHGEENLQKLFGAAQHDNIKALISVSFFIINK